MPIEDGGSKSRNKLLSPLNPIGLCRPLHYARIRYFAEMEDRMPVVLQFLRETTLEELIYRGVTEIPTCATPVRALPRNSAVALTS